MTKEKKLEYIADAYKTKKVEDAREEIVVIDDTKPEEFQKDIKELQFRLNNETGTFELDYEIMASACDVVGELSVKELEVADLYELSLDSASVYTATRIGYINRYNQDEISEAMKLHDCDIQTSAAIWYDEKVAIACEMLRDYVLA